MKRLTSHSKNSLFLTEIIFSLLFLSLSACICVQIFIGSKSSREQAREWNHIQEITVSVGEFLEGSNGTAEEFLSIYPDGTAYNNTLIYYYDSDWNNISSDEIDCMYSAELTFSGSIREKTAVLTFLKKDEILYEDTICFPVFLSRKEEADL